jgi:DNA-binding beta-propeller fold protein YncE
LSFMFVPAKRVDSWIDRVWILLQAFCVALIVTCIATGLAFGQSVQRPYRVLAQWPLEGTGSWRSLVNDRSSHLLYVVRNDRITVIDTAKGSTAGEVLGLSDARAIALDSAGKLGYVSDGITGNIHVFDRLARTLITTIVIGGTPDEVVLEPTTRQLFVFNAHNSTVAVVDVKSGRVAATIALPGRAASAVTDGHGSVFVNLNSTSQISKIDASSLKVMSTWSLSQCSGPSALGIDESGTRLFSVCENRLLMVSDVNKGQVVSSADIGEGARGVAFDPTDHLLFASNADGSLTVLRYAETGVASETQTLKTQPGSRLLAFDSANGRLYLVAAQFGQRPGPTSEELEFRPTVSPGSAAILVIGR